jgi:hypothetical protein
MRSVKPNRTIQFHSLPLLSSGYSKQRLKQNAQTQTGNSQNAFAVLFVLFKPDPLTRIRLHVTASCKLYHQSRLRFIALISDNG